MRKAFTLEKSFSYSSVHLNLSFTFKEAKKRKSSVKEREWDRIARRFVSFCTSFTIAGIIMVMSALHLSGLDSMPLLVSMRHRNFPAWTPKKHLVGLKYISYFLIDCRISYKFYAWLHHSIVFTIMSLTYILMFSPIWLANNIHELLVGGTNVIEAKGHDIKVVVVMILHERCFGSI